MSDFVDKFTNDAEQNKKKMIVDFEQKLYQDKQKNDELRQKLVLEKSETEIKYSKLQKEADSLK